MLTVTTVTLLLVMALALSRAFVGPTVFDRILAANMFGTKTVLLIAVIGFLFGRPEFLDIAMVYALINFIGVIGMLRLIEYLEDENRSSQEEDA
ncbi:monovalent cation/H+ antiporter complex subunit F [Spongiibacter sp.]|jgi:multicomponent Na+:H+ antiporter subunit F|uniref:monovalent cation/H+ antiporter complex subunit F n=1 Tax=Spongiibacter TaxID=630749 RepID=UPI000C0AB74C|nr:monovalent cation/H+ antiporter complex subunit F [Spongiibacter sp.]MAK45313.1 pH regulation protein F [Spongiibacter sp.]MEE2653308.1 monovalent cation/H+ antiporter complex subunit F [Pseudomonadota bacterium]|tara:strand:- start:694 stop:975 length:282 start_codon:yes stop_codon:yes gene_type:complete